MVRERDIMKRHFHYTSSQQWCSLLFVFWWGGTESFAISIVL